MIPKRYVISIIGNDNIDRSYYTTDDATVARATVETLAKEPDRIGQILTIYDNHYRTEVSRTEVFRNVDRRGAIIEASTKKG